MNTEICNDDIRDSVLYIYYIELELTAAVLHRMRNVFTYMTMWKTVHWPLLGNSFCLFINKIKQIDAFISDFWIIPLVSINPKRTNNGVFYDGVYFEKKNNLENSLNRTNFPYISASIDCFSCLFTYRTQSCRCPFWQPSCTPPRSPWATPHSGCPGRRAFRPGNENNNYQCLCVKTKKCF